MEIWKSIEGYEDYEVSNLGRVKSFKVNKVKIMKGTVNSLGYYRVKLSRNKKNKIFNVHVLMAKAFFNHTPDGNKGLVVDHIDNNKLNNKLDNLQLISNRENLSKDRSGASKHTGVSWYKARSKWLAGIRINGVRKHLGYFINEEEASKAYQKALKEL